jgi:esterase/lipase
MRAALPNVKGPVLLIHSKDDKYVLPENMPSIYERLGARDKEMLWVTGSGHVVTRDAARQQVFEAAAAFIHRVTNSDAD